MNIGKMNDRETREEKRMEITRENYKKAMKNVILSEGTGMELLQQAAEQANSRGRWLRKKVTAAILSVAVLGTLGTGVCYASTGQSPVSLFENLFINNNQEAVQKAANQFAESNETISYNDMDITLEWYVFNKEQGVILSQVKVSSDSVLLDWEELYEYTKDSGLEPPYQNAEEWKTACQKDPEEMAFYKYVCELMLEDRISIGIPAKDEWWGHETWHMEDEHTAYAYTMINAMNTADADFTDTVHLKIEDIANIDVKNPEDRILEMGEFVLKEAGKLDIRTLDCLSIPYCQSGEISGGHLMLNFNTADQDKWGLNGWPITTLTVKLKNGTQYVYDQKDYDISDETTMIEKENENIFMFSSVKYANSPHVQNLHASFPDFLDLNEIESISVDGNECFIK